MCTSQCKFLFTIYWSHSEFMHLKFEITCISEIFLSHSTIIPVCIYTNFSRGLFFSKIFLYKFFTIMLVTHAKLILIANVIRSFKKYKKIKPKFVKSPSEIYREDGKYEKSQYSLLQNFVSAKLFSP